MAPLLAVLGAATGQWQAAQDRLARAEGSGNIAGTETEEEAAATQHDGLCRAIAAFPSQTLADIASKLKLVWQLQTGRSRAPA